MRPRIILVTLLLLFCFSSLGLASEQVFFYHTDPAGTPLSMTNSAGTVVWKTDYKPFGEEYAVTETAVNDKRFVGKEKDKETGLSYFGARYEDARIGRFTGVDPVRAVDPQTSQTNEKLLLNPQRLNTYSYGLNNPYRYVDPDGREVVVIGSTKFKKSANSALKQIKRKSNGLSLYNNLNKSSNTHNIVESNDGNSASPSSGYSPGHGTGSTIYFDPNSLEGGVNSKGSTTRPPYVGLSHEMGHSEAIDQGTQTFNSGTGVPGTTPPSESNSIRRENQIRNEHKIPKRSSYY